MKFLINRDVQTELVSFFVENMSTLNGGIEEEVAIITHIFEHFMCASLLQSALPISYNLYPYNILIRGMTSGKYIDSLPWTRHMLDYP